jgi:GNAT superfamily N-acetyltransferase
MRPHTQEGPAVAGDYERCVRFLERLDEAVAQRVERLGSVTAILDPRLPRVWDANYLRLDRTGPDAAALAGLADRVIGEAGMDHRTVNVHDPDEGNRLAPGFKELGWTVQRNLVMVLRRAPDQAPSKPVTELGARGVKALRQAQIIEQGWGTGELVEELQRRDEMLGSVAGDRWFAAGVGGRPASCCRLLALDGVGQVEDVITLAKARNRGLATAVVLAAVEASRRDGDELTFLLADADDWPRELYARLGFDPLRIIHRFRRPAP